MIKVRKLESFNKLNPLEKVTVKRCGRFVETVYLSHRNKGGIIKKLNKDEYVNLRTGELKKFEHKENRAENTSAVRTSLKKLRDYINTNVTNPNNCLWITLTYKENMQDTKKLYLDFDKFMKRLRYQIGACEYIVAMEPQGRGAWHSHLLLIFENQAPFIPNKELAEIWGNGFVKINKIDNVDNIGAYLTAYLGDMELNIENFQNGNIKTITTKENTKKSIVKGGRLNLYPNGFNLFRKSKGIKPPVVEVLKEYEVLAETKKYNQTYENAIEVELEDGKILTFYYRNYDTKNQKGKNYDRV